MSNSSAAYAVSFTKRAAKDLGDLPAKERARIVKRIESVALDPIPSAAKAMAGEWENHYRLRVGDYRVIYAVGKGTLVIVVVRVGHRREVYRNK